MKRKDINIYEILKGVEYGTELYTPMCGNVVFTFLPCNTYEGHENIAFTDYDIENLPF